MMMAYHPTPYTDEDCSNQYCYVCQEAGRRRLRSRGLCKTSNLDNIYVPVNRDNALMFSGWKQSDIYYDKVSGMWTAKVTIHGTEAEYVTIATTKASYESLSLGTHKWTV